MPSAAWPGRPASGRMVGASTPGTFTNPVKRNGPDPWLQYHNGYYYLLVDPYPPFDGDEHPEYPLQLQIGPRSEMVSRVLEVTQLDQQTEAFQVLPDPA